MTQLIDKILSIPVPFNMIVIIVAISFGTAIITSIAKQIRKYACLRHELDFKRDMIDRGMSVAEVEQLMAAKSPTQINEGL